MYIASLKRDFSYYSAPSPIESISRILLFEKFPEWTDKCLSTPDHLFHLVIEGTYHLKVNDREYHVKPGHLIYFHASENMEWRGDYSMQDYYTQHDAGQDPFNWIKVHPFMDEQAQKQFPVDHAGKLETALMMVFCPEGVDMERFTDTKWFAKQAPQANMEYTKKAKQAIFDGLRKTLKS